MNKLLKASLLSLAVLFSFNTSVRADDVDPYVKLLLHMDGSDGSTTFTDSELAPTKTVTAVGNAQIDTAQSAFGGASGLFDGTGDYLTVPDSDDFHFSGADFTIDFKLRLAALPGSGVIYGLASQDNNGSNVSWAMDFYHNGTNRVLRFYYSTNGTSYSGGYNYVWNCSVDTQYHIALVRYGSTVTFYIDGVAVGTPINIGTSSLYNSANNVHIGGYAYGTGNHSLNGHIDEFRVSKGIARWTSNFTPPASAYSDTTSDSTVTASARQYTAANVEYHIKGYSSLVGLNPGDTTFYAGGIIYLDSTANSTIFSRWTENGSSNPYALMIISNALRWSVTADGQTASAVNAVHGTTLATGQWYGFEVFHDHVNNKIGVTLNRTGLVETAHTTGIYASGTSDFVVGALDPDSGNKYALGGKIAKLWFYNTIPSDAIRDSLYNSKAGKSYHDLTASEKSGLISYYDASETSGNLIDALGNNNLTDTATVTSGTGITRYTAIDASQFTASGSEYLSISDASQTNLSPGNTDRYWCGFVYMDSLGVQRGLVGQWGSATPNNDWAIYVSSANRVRLIVSSNGGTSTTTTPNDDDTLLTASGWYFFEGWHDSVNDIIGVQLNRAVQNTIAYALGIGDNSAAFTVGSLSAADYMNGRMSNVVAISGIPTDSERDALFNRGMGVHYTDRPTLSTATYVSWWPMTESSGTRIDVIGDNDLSDNATVTSATGVVYDEAEAQTSSRRSVIIIA